MPCYLDRLSLSLMLEFAELALEFQGGGLNHNGQSLESDDICVIRIIHNLSSANAFFLCSEFVESMHFTGDRFIKTITIDWAELRDDYFVTLRKISMPFFNLWDDPSPCFVRERIEQIFASVHAQLRLL